MTETMFGLEPPTPTPPVTDSRMERLDRSANTWMNSITGIIEDSIRNQPRSLQTRIGPSELGTPCEHCLAAKLAGWEKIERDVAWLPFIGTCVHAYLEDLFEQERAKDIENGDSGLFQAERRVQPGFIRGEPLTGSTDLYLEHLDGVGSPGMTIDWKIVGKSTLDTVKRTGPSEQYKAQAHLYALGWNNAGWPTSHVAIYFMPRNAPNLHDGHIWVSRYDQDAALAALDRANKLAQVLDGLAAISTDTRDQYITGLPRDPACWDCNKYSDHPKQAPITDISTLLT